MSLRLRLMLLPVAIAFTASCGAPGSSDVEPPAAPSTAPAETPAPAAPAVHDQAAWTKAVGALVDQTLPELDAVYADRRYLLAAPGGLSQAGQTVRTRLAHAARDGLDPETYHNAAIAQSLDAGDVATTELLLFDGALRYARDMAADPDTIDLKATSSSIALAASKPGGMAAWLDGLRPDHPQYIRLMKAADTYADIVKAGGWPTAMPRLPLPDPKKPFRYKANYRRYPDQVVERIKKRLAGERLYAGPINNEWDDALTDAVVRYRRNNQLEDQPWIDFEMTRAMQVTAEFRLAQIHVNLQRLRSSRFGKDPYSVYVNVPAFQGELWDKGERKLTFRTVVGSRRKSRHKKTRKWEASDATPLFSDKMESVVMAPYWTVPASIRVQLMRRAEKDPTFLAREGYDVVGVAKGKLLRQRPGPNNALGRVKFIFPNDHDIYLHDTPETYLFTLPMRAFSHGCIRVENPLDLALYLLQRQDPEWTMRKLERRGRSPVETAVELEDGPTVHLEYITVAVTDDGDVQFHWDIYRHDSRAILERDGIEYAGDLYYP